MVNLSGPSNIIIIYDMTTSKQMSAAHTNGFVLIITLSLDLGSLFQTNSKQSTLLRFNEPACSTDTYTNFNLLNSLEAEYLKYNK